MLYYLYKTLYIRCQAKKRKRGMAKLRNIRKGKGNIRCQAKKKKKENREKKNREEIRNSPAKKMDFSNGRFLKDFSTISYF